MAGLLAGAACSTPKASRCREQCASEGLVMRGLSAAPYGFDARAACLCGTDDPPRESRGCDKDLDCKGDRICDRGECVYPDDVEDSDGVDDGRPVEACFEPRAGTPGRARGHRTRTLAQRRTGTAWSPRQR